eukprot:scaffold152_cov164-Ochromonas_danica.AAC.1
MSQYSRSSRCAARSAYPQTFWASCANMTAVFEVAVHCWPSPALDRDGRSAQDFAVLLPRA